jgi:hypothetical protein
MEKALEAEGEDGFDSTPLSKEAPKEEDFETIRVCL